MFCVVECETTPPRRRFWRWERSGKPGWRKAWRDKPRYCHLTLEFPLNATESFCRKRTEGAFSGLAHEGCVGVVLPGSFPFPALPGDYGLAVSTAVPLYRRMAGRIALWAADTLHMPKNDLIVSLIGKRITNDLLNTAATLCHRARGFIVDVGGDTEAFCYGFGRYYGVSARGGLHHPARLYLIFDTPASAFSVPDNALVLNFSGGEPAVYGGRAADGALLDPPRRLWAGWPERCDTPSLLSALVAEGALRSDDLHIRGLSLRGHALAL